MRVIARFMDARNTAEGKFVSILLSVMLVFSFLNVTMFTDRANAGEDDAEQTLVDELDDAVVNKPQGDKENLEGGSEEVAPEKTTGDNPAKSKARKAAPAAAAVNKVDDFAIEETAVEASGNARTNLLADNETVKELEITSETISETVEVGNTINLVSPQHNLKLSHSKDACTADHQTQMLVYPRSISSISVEVEKNDRVLSEPFSFNSTTNDELVGSDDQKAAYLSSSQITALKPGIVTITVHSEGNFADRYDSICPDCGKSFWQNPAYEVYKYIETFEIHVVANYTLNYNTNGGDTIASTTQTVAATTATFTTPTPVRDGYTFLGWSETEDATTATILSGAEYTMNWVSGSTTEKTLYAVWARATATYQVKHSFEPMKDTENRDSTEKLSGNVGELTKAQAREVEGFQAEPFDQKVIDAEGNTCVDISYNRLSYPVTYTFIGDAPENADELLPETVDYKFEKSGIEVAKAPVAEGYVFEGWKTADVAVADDGTFAMPAKGVAFTGEWKRVYELNVQANGYTGVYDAQRHDSNGIAHATVNIPVLGSSVSGVEVKSGGKTFYVEGVTVAVTDAKGDTSTATNAGEYVATPIVKNCKVYNATGNLVDPKYVKVNGIPAKITISQRKVTASASDTRTYNDDVQALEITADNISSGTLAGADKFSAEVLGKVEGKNASSIPYIDVVEKDTKIVDAAGNDVSDNYIVNVEGSLIINKAEAKDFTVSVSLDDWIYGDKAKTEQINMSGPGAHGYGDPSYAYYKGDEKLDGKPSAVGSYIVVATWAETANLPELSASDTFTISQREVTVSASATRTYNDDVQVLEITADDLAVGSLADGDKFSAEVLGKIKGKNASIDPYTDVVEKDATIVDADGNDASDNYIVTVKGSLTINKATGNKIWPGRLIFASANSVSKVYDGVPEGITGRAEYSGIAEFEGSRIEYSLTGNEDDWSDEVPQFTEAGSYSVYVRATHENYETSEAVVATFTIEQRRVRIAGENDSMNPSAWSAKVTYDGTSHGSTNYSVEDANTTADANRGILSNLNHAFMADGFSYTLSGTNVGTYTAKFANSKTPGKLFSVVDEAGNDVTENYYPEYWIPRMQIVAKPITPSEEGEHALTFEGPSNTVYNGYEQKQSLVVKDGDTELTEGVDYTLAYTSAVNAGTVTVTVTGMGNYTGTDTVTYEIVPRPVRVFAGKATMTYGELQSLEYDVYTVEEINGNRGLVPGDEIIGVEQTLAEEVSAATPVDEYVGWIAVADQDAVAKANPNYDITFVNGDLTVARSTDNLVTIQNEGMANGLMKTYDGLGASVAASALRDGSTMLYSIDNGESWSEENPVFTEAGIYQVQVKATNPNFEDTEAVEAMVRINQRPVTITVANATKVAGAADPAFTGSITAGSLVRASDLGVVAYSRTNDNQAVGTYAGVLTALYTENPNYDVTVVPGTFTITAAPAAIVPPAVPLAAPPAAPAAPAAPAVTPIADDPTPQAATPTETIEDDATPQAARATIPDEDVPLGAFDEPHCWVHWVMLVGILLTAAYGVVVIRRRVSLADQVTALENDVRGVTDAATETVPAASRQTL